MPTSLYEDLVARGMTAFAPAADPSNPPGVVPPTPADGPHRFVVPGATPKEVSRLGWLHHQVMRHEIMPPGKTRDAFKQTMRTMNGFSEGSKGGFLIDFELAKEVWDRTRSADGPLARCWLFYSGKREFLLPIFGEFSRADGSRLGGINGVWIGSNEYLGTPDSPTSFDTIQSGPRLASVLFSAKRIIIYSAPWSNDLLSDTVLVDSMLDVASFKEIRFNIERQMIRGNGAVGPYGILGAPGTIEVDKKSGQSAATIVAENVSSMWKRLYGPLRSDPSTCWLCHDDVAEQLDEVAQASAWPVNLYIPAGVNGAPFAFLKGKPVIPSEHCSPLGTKGDLILGCWSQYGLCLMKSAYGQPSMELSFGGVPLSGENPDLPIEKTRSDHEFFATDSVSFKYKFRCDGHSLWPNPITPQFGTNTVSAFVVLEDRS